MQELGIKIKDKQGNNVIKHVKIIRAWSEGNGNQLFLHANGTYGYKDGSPVKSEAELNIITDKGQRRLARLWWEQTGARKSRDYYRKQEQRLLERQSAGVPNVVLGDASDLDMVLYIRRPITTRSRDAFSDPNTWYEWFDARPEWWGYATVIELAGYRYERVQPEEDRDADKLSQEATDADDEIEITIEAEKKLEELKKSLGKDKKGKEALSKLTTMEEGISAIKLVQALDEAKGNSLADKIENINKAELEF